MTIERAAELLASARHAVALTGAGVSTDSGIPDFRGDAGLWREVDFDRVASIDGFLADPAGFYRFWSDRLAALDDVVPNMTHEVLGALEAAGRLAAVITQNIDGLHQRAGSRTVHEVHGTFRTARCLGCRRRSAIEDVFAMARRDGAPRCASCGELLKPDVVLFGETLPPAFELGVREIDRADVLVVLGSSLEVHPVAGLVPRAAAGGAAVVLLNRDPTPFDGLAEVVIHDELAAIMPRLAARLPLDLRSR